MRGATRWSAVLLSGLVASCGAGSGPGPNDADSLPVLEATETLRLGSVDDPDVGFSSIADMAVDRDGLLYVLDTQAVEVRVFDGATRVRTIGGAGGGPGELRGPGSMGLLGDTLWVIDQYGRRVTLFRRDGAVLNTWSLSPPRFGPIPRVGVSFLGMRLRPDRRIISTRMIAVSMSSPGEIPAGSFDIPVLLLDTTGAAVDTLGVRPHSLSSPSIQVEGRRLRLPQIPSFDSWLRPTDDGSFTVDMPVPEDPGSGSFIVTRIGEIGDTVYRTVLHYRPRAMTGDVVGSLLRPWAEESSREVSVGADVLEAQGRAALELPAFLAPLSSAHLGTNGVIWLRRQDDGAASLEWVLIDSVGRPSGRVALPRNVMPRWSDGSTVWAVLTDELDVPWLVRYELASG